MNTLYENFEKIKEAFSGIEIKAKLAEEKKLQVEEFNYKEPEFVMTEWQSVKNTFKQIEASKMKLINIEEELKERRHYYKDLNI